AGGRGENPRRSGLADGCAQAAARVRGTSARVAHSPAVPLSVRPTDSRRRVRGPDKDADEGDAKRREQQIAGAAGWPGRPATGRWSFKEVPGAANTALTYLRSFATLQSFTVPSSLPAATNSSSGEKATGRIRNLDGRLRTSTCLATSYTLAPSKHPQAIRSPL